MNLLKYAIPQELELAAQIAPISADELKRYKVAVVFTWGVGFILLIIFLLRMTYTQEGAHSSIYLLPLMSLICWSGPTLMRALNLYTYTPLLVWACGHIVLIFRALESGGVASPAILWFIISPILVTFVSSSLLRIFTYIMSIFELALIGLLHSDGFSGPPNHINPFAYFSLVMVLSGISTLLISQYEKFRKEHLSHQINREKMLSSSQKLASLGSLAGGLSHEFNSPLSVFRGRIDIIHRQYEAGKLDDKIFTNSVKGMNNALNRMQSIINLMRTFTNDDFFIVMDKIDFNLVIKETLDQIGLKKKIDYVVLQLPKEAVWVNGNKDLLRQAIYNIILNAVEALETEDSPTLKISIKEKDKNAILKIQDNGPGLENVSVDQIWEPFYTTKAPVESGLTTFQVVLPRTENS